MIYVLSEARWHTLTFCICPKHHKISWFLVAVKFVPSKRFRLCMFSWLHFPIPHYFGGFFTGRQVSMQCILHINTIQIATQCSLHQEVQHLIACRLVKPTLPNLHDLCWWIRVPKPRNIGRNQPITVGFQLSGDPVVDEMNAVPLAHFIFGRHFCLSTVIHPNQKSRKLKHFSRSGCCAHSLWGTSCSKSSDILPAQHPTLALSLRPVKVWQREMMKEESNISMISRSWSQKVTRSNSRFGALSVFVESERWWLLRCPTLSPTKIFRD